MLTTHYWLYNAHCTLNTKCYTLHTAHCTLHTAHCTLHTAHCTLHTAHLHTTLLSELYSNLFRISLPYTLVFITATFVYDDNHYFTPFSITFDQINSLQNFTLICILSYFLISLGNFVNFFVKLEFVVCLFW